MYNFLKIINDFSQKRFLKRARYKHGLSEISPSKSTAGLWFESDDGLEAQDVTHWFLSILWHYNLLWQRFNTMIDYTYFQAFLSHVSLHMLTFARQVTYDLRWPAWKIRDKQNLSTRGLATFWKFQLPENDCLTLAALRSCSILWPCGGLLMTL